jgi:hypothetical protein
MPTDSAKRINCVKACFTDREYIDLGRLCAREDRSPAEMVWVLARRAMYGIVPQDNGPDQGTQRDHDAL